MHMSTDIHDDSLWVPADHRRRRPRPNADGFVTIKVTTTTPVDDGAHRRDWQWMWGHS